MKPFDPTLWKELYDGEALESTQTLLWLRATAPVSAIVSKGGAEGIAGYGPEIQVRVSPGTQVSVIRDEGVRVFYYAPPVFVIQALDGPNHFNADMMPRLSGSMEAVIRANREHALIQRQMRRRMVDQYDAYLRERMAPLPDPAPAPAPAPAPSPDPGTTDPGA